MRWHDLEGDLETVLKLSWVDQMVSKIPLFTSPTESWDQLIGWPPNRPQDPAWPAQWGAQLDAAGGSSRFNIHSGNHSFIQFIRLCSYQVLTMSSQIKYHEAQYQMKSNQISYSSKSNSWRSNSWRHWGGSDCVSHTHTQTACHCVVDLFAPFCPYLLFEVCCPWEFSAIA